MYITISNKRDTKFRKIVEYFFDMTKSAQMVYGVQESVLELRRSLLVEELELYDEWFRKSGPHKEE